jgi:hypothetical protein
VARAVGRKKEIFPGGMLSNIEKPVCGAAQDSLGAAPQTDFSLERKRGGGDFLVALIRIPLVRRTFNNSLDRSIVSGLRTERLGSSDRFPAGHASRSAKRDGKRHGPPMIQTVAARAVGWRSEMSTANRPHGPAR